MVQRWKFGVRHLATITVSIGGSFLPDLPGDAQLLPDNSLGAESSIINLGTNQVGQAADIIAGGARRNGNLFHSFQEFNVGNLQRVYFANPAGVGNILSRVTGPNPSNILGRLGVLGNANLFLINPNGIVFGPNATLDVRGSFMASTADSFKFDNGFAFSASNPQALPLLTVNVPIGLQYGNNPGSLQVQESTLRVPSGQTLALIGGDVRVTGGRLFAPGGRVELAGVAADGNINLIANNSSPRLSFPISTPRADVFITNGSDVSVRRREDGNIAIHARNIDITESRLLAGIEPGLGFDGSRAGDIEINAIGSINLSTSLIKNDIGREAKGIAGNITITTESLFTQRGSDLAAGTLGEGNAGNVIINAGDQVSFDNSNIFSTVEQSGIGDGGNITITTGTLSLTNTAQLIASTRGQGKAGNVIINARDTVSFNRGSAFSRVDEKGNGNGGNIIITSGSLLLTNGARINASTSGIGDGGRVMIDARDRISLEGGSNQLPTSILSNVEEGAKGNTNGVSITATHLSVTNGALLESRTRGIGNAASINVNVRDSAIFDGSRNGWNSGAYSGVERRAVGNGDNIQIRAGSLQLTDGARLSASTNGTGNAGSVIIDVRDTASFDNSFTFSRVNDTGIGDAGNISVTTGALSVTGGAQMQTLTTGQGKAGNVSINARDRVSFDGRGAVFSTVEQNGVGDGGSINITTASLSITNTAQLSTSTKGQGKAGNVIIDARNTVGFDDSNVFSTVEQNGIGDGGSITITTGTLSLTNTAQLSTFTERQGNAGNVIINARDRVSFDDSNVFSTVEQNGIGDGGNISISTGVLSLTNTAQLIASTRGTGKAGNVIINARDRVSFDNSYAFSRVNERGIGDGGNVTITTGTLSVTEGAQMQTLTRGIGNAGNVIINARDQVSFDGRSAVFSTVEQNGVGDGGSINITTGMLSLTNTAQLIASSRGQGKAGSLAVEADVIQLDNRGRISADTVSDGGNINLRSSLLTLRRNSSITTNATSAATGGNINIDAGFIVSAPNENNDIIANAFAGSGGKITITAQNIFWFDLRSREDLQRLLNTTDPTKLNPRNLPTNDITAFSQANPTIDTGTVRIQSPDLDPTQGVTPLPTDFTDRSQLITATCLADVGSSFAITGRGGLPEDPRQPLMGQVIWQDERGVGENGVNREVERKAIFEAQGWIVDRTGTVVLVAQQPQTQQKIALEYPMCAVSKP